MKYPVTVIDVSEHQGTIDWTRVEAGRSPRIFGAMIRASHGTTSDLAFIRNWSEAGHVGLRRGAYHFLEDGPSGLSQAEHFTAVIKAGAGKGWGELPPAGDWEQGDGALFDEFMQVAAGYTHRALVAYEGAWARGHGGGRHHGTWLWAPDYAGPPILPAGWRHWTLWQHTDHLSVPGITGPVDASHFRGGRIRWGMFLAAAKLLPPHR